MKRHRKHREDPCSYCGGEMVYKYRSMGSVSVMYQCSGCGKMYSRWVGILGKKDRKKR